MSLPLCVRKPFPVINLPRFLTKAARVYRYALIGSLIQARHSDTAITVKGMAMAQNFQKLRAVRSELFSAPDVFQSMSKNGVLSMLATAVVGRNTKVRKAMNFMM